MKMSIKSDVLQSDPTSNWHHVASGPHGETWATGHMTVGNQEACGSWASGMIE